MKDKEKKREKRLKSSYRVIENMRERKRKSRVKRKTNALKTAMGRITSFIRAVRYGPIFPCCSCEQMMFENGVLQITEDLLKTIKIACDKRENSLFFKVFGEKSMQQVLELL